MKVVVVGGVAGGASAAARLRGLDESAESSCSSVGIHLVCQLRTAILHRWRNNRPGCPDLTPRFRFHVDVRVDSEVTAIDPKADSAAGEGEDRGEYTESYIAGGPAPFTLRRFAGCLRPCAIFPIPLRSVAMWKNSTPRAPWS